MDISQEFEGTKVTFRPIDQWPQEETDNRTSSRFRANFSSTISLLEKELRMLKAKNVVIQLDLGENQIRLDGFPYANASPETPRVIVSFQADGEPLMYPCDTWDDWTDNLRAIALTLNKLRAVDRYGVSKRGEQYRGWKRLPGSGQTTVAMGAQEAAGVLAAESVYSTDEILTSYSMASQAFKDAAKDHHPDRGGEPGRWHRISDAREALQRHHGVH